MMKITRFTDVEATHFDRPDIKGVAARVVIGKNDVALFTFQRSATNVSLTRASSFTKEMEWMCLSWG